MPISTLHKFLKIVVTTERELVIYTYRKVSFFLPGADVETLKSHAELFAYISTKDTTSTAYSCAAHWVRDVSIQHGDATSQGLNSNFLSQLETIKIGLHMADN